MSSATNIFRLLAALLPVFLTVTPAAYAATGCPPAQDGHRLARLDGASLYQGDPAQNMLLAPTQENPGGRGVNIWSLPDARGVVLVCRYENQPALLVLTLPPGISSCRQDLRAGTFECR